MTRKRFVLLFVLSALADARALGPDLLKAPLRSTPDKAEETDVVQLSGLPAMGKWMLDASGSPAHWLGEIYRGRTLREPINVVVVDSVATSPEEAKERIVRASSRAGYPVRMGHSSGYRAVIGGQAYPQLPAGWDDAFSDNLFELTNNHGRLFGPHRQEASYVFVGAFSREEVSPFRWPEHQYASFNRARDDFARKLDENGEYKLTGYVAMANALRDDPSVTTGDHDGRAALLIARK